MNPVRNTKSNLQWCKQDIGSIAFVRNKIVIISNGVKKTFSSGILVLLITLGLSPQMLSADSKLAINKPEPEISMDFQDAKLKDALKVFSIQSGLNFIASEVVQDRKITLYMDKVPLNRAMDKLFKANNLSYELDKDSNIFVVKDWGKPELETITRVFYLKYASVSTSSLEQEVYNQIESISGTTGTTAGTTGTTAGTTGTTAGATGATAGTTGATTGTTGTTAGITEAVKKLLSKSGTVIEDSRTNSLIVTDTPNRMAVIAQVIASLDIPVPQVMLEVEMLDVSKNKIDRLGIKFTDVMTSSMFEAIITGAKVSTGFPLPGHTISTHSFTKTLTPGTVDFSTLTWKVFFDFIKQQSDTKILARPRILTMNNATAEIKITTQEAIGSITTTQGQGTASTTTTSAERIETGVSLRVTPQVNPDTGEITMVILPIVKDATTSTFNTTFKDPEERSTKSVVRIKDGETVIIGGLIRNDKSETITKLPLLGDIPLIGGLFRHKYKDKDKERELLVFITPHIIKDTNIKLAQTEKVTLPEREQATPSGFSRESVISLSLDTFEKK